MTRRVGDRLPIRVSLYNLALTRQVQGNLTGATGLLEERLVLSAEVGDEASAAYCLEGLAALAGLQDDPERAAHLYGPRIRCSKPQASVPVYAYAPDRSQHDRVVAGVRSRMEKAAFEEAWGRGRVMGHGRAVEYTLRGVRKDRHARSAMVYEVREMGIIVRCPSCDNTFIRLAHNRGRSLVDLRGTRCLTIG
ncbi:MAG: DUF6510 family protein [Chloroflexota bacterium]|nr:DUF6510 family protein [Chloroflexota bacterium]